MRPGWTAGVTRGRLLLSRAIGREHARAIAGCPSLAEGVAALAGSAYGERVHVDEDLVGAERGVAETLLWHLQILAGWLPAAGAGLVRVLAGWFELANVDARVAALVGDGREPTPFVLGALATAWPHVEQARTVEEVGEAVAGSAWGDCGRGSPAELTLGLRVAYARRVREAAPAAARWVGGASALLIARELLVVGTRGGVTQLEKLPGIGARALGASSLSELRAGLPADAAWALDATSDPAELWKSELRWWSDVESDASQLLRMGGDEAVVLAAVALLAVDAVRATRGLRAASHGGDPELVEWVGGAA